MPFISKILFPRLNKSSFHWQPNQLPFKDIQLKELKYPFA